MKENQSGPMEDREYWGYHGGRAPACHDCAMFFYGCQQIDGERVHPDAAKHYAKCMQWWDYRHSTAIGEAVVASFESMAAKQSAIVAAKEVAKGGDTMSVHNEAEMRDDISEYLQLAAKIKHLEAEQAILKEQLEAGMSAAGVLEVLGTDGTATMQAKNEYKFDVGAILKVIPGVVAKLKITNEVFNQILVGNEVAIGAFRKIVKTTYPIVVKAAK